MNTLVMDVMTASVIWVERDTPFAAIAAALREYRVSAFPVLDETGEVIGVVLPGRRPARQLADESHGLVNRAVVGERAEGACEVGVECGALVGEDRGREK